MRIGGRGKVWEGEDARERGGRKRAPLERRGVSGKAKEALLSTKMHQHLFSNFHPPHPALPPGSENLHTSAFIRN